MSTIPPLKRSAWLAWVLAGVIATLSLVYLALILAGWSSSEKWIDRATEIIVVLLPAGYALMAALIASRQPRNVIAWLLMTFAIAITTIVPIDLYIDAVVGDPTPTLLTLTAVWYQNWSWLLFIVPLLLLLMLFPTGQAPSPRLRWVPYYAVGLVSCFILLTTFAKTLSPTYYPEWMLPNPIGLIPISAEPVILPLILGGLLLLIVICPASLFYRYRRAQAVEREQIKWLLYTTAVFVAVYLPPLSLAASTSSWVMDLFELLVFLTLGFFPVAIAIAILRYRLWEIDVLIRRTLIYTALTVSLGLVFLGAVALLGQIFGVVTGTANSPAAIVISTLAIAALFNPLRRRIQHDIDRRFFRKKYDAGQALERFALSVRDEVELERLSKHLLDVIQETMEPEEVVLWLRPGEKR